MENTNVPVISAKDLNLWYGDFKALKGISASSLFCGSELSGRVNFAHIFTVRPLEPVKTQ